MAMGIGKKLYIGFGATLLLMLLLYFVNEFALTREHRSRAATMQSLEAIQAMEASKLQMMLNRQALANYLIGGNQQELTTFNAGLSELENRFKTADARAFTDEQHTAVAKMRAQEQQWLRNYANP